MLRVVVCTLLLLAAARAQDNSSCLIVPEDPACADFTMPPSMVTDGIEGNCRMMNMVGTTKRSCIALQALAFLTQPNVRLRLAILL